MSELPTPLSLPIDNEILHQRLLTRQGGTGAPQRGEISKCALRFRDYARNALSVCYDDDDAKPEISQNVSGGEAGKSEEKKSLCRKRKHEETESITDSFKRDLQLHGIEMRKLLLMVKSADAELVESDRTQIEMNRSIAEMKREIEQLKIDLAHEKRVRRNLEQYEVLARHANKKPTRKDTEAKLVKIRTETQLLETQDLQATRELETKEKQFELLLNSIYDLKTTLAQNEKRMKNFLDEEEEKKKEKEQEEGEEIEDQKNDPMCVS